MTILIVACVASILIILLDAFESMILPRRVSRKLRPARLVYRYTWKPWSAVARRLAPGKRRETLLGFFGPLSAIMLLVFWAVGLVLAFGVLHWALKTPMHMPDHRLILIDYIYMSGVTFFTLGFGDITPSETLGRVITVAEAGIGFGFLAVVIGYLPVIYTAFSRREHTVSLLDARAGSPPAATRLLLRLARSQKLDVLDSYLREWEQWSAELLESHISFPMLTYYRSQHDNQSWLAALTFILDTCALVITQARKINSYQAEMTFAMARHAAVDLSLIFNVPPKAPRTDRLPRAELDQLWKDLREVGLADGDADTIEPKLSELREMYEPFCSALSRHLLFVLPPFIPSPTAVDNWQTSAWTRRVKGIDKLSDIDPSNRHFD